MYIQYINIYTKGFKWSPQLGPDYAERCKPRSQTTDVHFPIWFFTYDSLATDEKSPPVKS